MKDRISRLKKTVGIVLVLLGIGVGSIWAEGPTLKIALGDWCPYSCDPAKEDGKIGYIPEILMIVFQQAGFKVETQLMPFTRILKSVQNGSFTVVPGMVKKNAPDLVFPETPIGLSTYIFYVAKGSSWRYQGFESLTKLQRLGLIQNYSYEVLDPDIARFLKAPPAKNDYITGVKPLERNFMKLLFERVDTVPEDQWVVIYTLNKKNSRDKVDEAGTIGNPVPVYVGFSPAIPQSQEYARMLDEGVTELRKTGELHTILNRYGVEDWVK